jgi:creatinine amidohydrolase
MADDRVFIGDFTRKEFRERMEGGLIKAAIVPVSSTEQHQEHLHMGHDHFHANYMAEQIAKRMLPSVVVATPINIGVSEHHMEVGPGTLTVRPEIFCEFVFDVCDSLVRTGITNVLILNGHGGNVKPMMYRLDEYRERLSNIYSHGKMAGAGVNYLGPPERQGNSSAEDRAGSGPAMPQPGRSDSGAQSVNLRFQSYWDIYDPAFVFEHMVAGNAPGHACEYETSTMLHLFPERECTPHRTLCTARHCNPWSMRTVWDPVVSLSSQSTCTSLYCMHLACLSRVGAMMAAVCRCLCGGHRPEPPGSTRQRREG